MYIVETFLDVDLEEVPLFKGSVWLVGRVGAVEGVQGKKIAIFILDVMVTGASKADQFWI